MSTLARMLLSCLESLGLIAVMFFLRPPISALGASAEEIYAGLTKMPKNQRQRSCGFI